MINSFSWDFNITLPPVTKIGPPTPSCSYLFDYVNPLPSLGHLKLYIKKKGAFSYYVLTKRPKSRPPPLPSLFALVRFRYPQRAVRWLTYFKVFVRKKRNWFATLGTNEIQFLEQKYFTQDRCFHETNKKSGNCCK